MQIVFFTYPDFHHHHQSMPRFAGYLVNGMQDRGHDVQIWCPKAYFFRLPLGNKLRKWLGYFDQYILFPIVVRRRVKACSSNTLFVVTDHALGIWVPLICHRTHVIHCHDFLAQLSAFNIIIENSTSWTGKVYQKLIRSGFKKGEYFISVSQNTREHLNRFLLSRPKLSEVVYNGLNRIYKPYSSCKARDLVTLKRKIPLRAGYLLHVGGNQWYKNRVGLIELYDTWRTIYGFDLPLLLIGELPGNELLRVIINSPFKTDIHVLNHVNDEELVLFYSGASVFLYPSLAEGFGWPIAEAMACGCLTITTNELPMTEVAGEAGFFIARRPWNKSEAIVWALESARVVNDVILLSSEKRMNAVKASIENSKRFDMEIALDKIEKIYNQVINYYDFSHKLTDRSSCLNKIDS